MKFLTNKKITSKLIIVIVALILFNFICPAYQVQASFGGMLLSPIKSLLLAIVRGVYTLIQGLVLDIWDEFDDVPHMVLSPRANFCK